jgi:hypothetical protein
MSSVKCTALAFGWKGDNEVDWINFTKDNNISIKWSFIKDTNETTLKVFVDLFPPTGYGRPHEWITVPVGTWLVFGDTQTFPQLCHEISLQDPQPRGDG